MSLWRSQISMIERQILTLIDSYEARFGNKLTTMEKLATGAIRKRLWFLAISVIVSLLPESTADRLELCHSASSKRDKVGTDLSKSAWRTYWDLAAIRKLSCRDLRVAAMRNFIAKDGKVDILISLVRQLAFLAVICISMITLVYVVFVFALWSSFTLDTHIAVVIFQVVFFAVLTITMALLCFIVSYSVFVNGILPLSTAYKFKRREIDFLHNGILYQIHE